MPRSNTKAGAPGSMNGSINTAINRVLLLQGQKCRAVESKNALLPLGHTKQDMKNSVAEKEEPLPSTLKEPWSVQLGPLISTPLETQNTCVMKNQHCSSLSPLQGHKESGVMK